MKPKIDQEENMIEEKFYKNNVGQMLEVYIELDTGTSNPMDQDTPLHFNTWKPYYSLQKSSYNSLEQWFNAHIGEDAFEQLRQNSVSIHETMKEFLKKMCESLEEKSILAFPIFCYDTDFDAPLCFFTGDKSKNLVIDFVGFAWADQTKLEKEYGSSCITDEIREKAKGFVQEHLNLFTHFCNGEVYGYNLYDAAGAEIDGGSGFIADTEKDLLEVIKESLPYFIKDKDFVEFIPEEELA